MQKEEQVTRSFERQQLSQQQGMVSWVSLHQWWSPLHTPEQDHNWVGAWFKGAQILTRLLHLYVKCTLIVQISSEKFRSCIDGQPFLCKSEWQPTNPIPLEVIMAGEKNSPWETTVLNKELQWSVDSKKHTCIQKTLWFIQEDLNWWIANLEMILVYHLYKLILWFHRAM